MSSYSDRYSDDESIDVHVRRVMQRDRSPAPAPRRGPAAPQYIQTVTRDVRDTRPYYQPAPVLLQPERTIVTTQTRTQSRERRSSPPSQAPVAPVVIHNKIINDNDDYSDYSSDDSRHHRRHSHHRSHSRHSRASSAGSFDDARERYELERARRELEALRLANAKKDQINEGTELVRTKLELERSKRMEEDLAYQRRLKDDVELYHTKEDLERVRRNETEREAEERFRRKMEAEKYEELQRKRDEEHRMEDYRRKTELEERRKGEDKRDQEDRIKRELRLRKLEEDEKEEAEKRRMQEYHEKLEADKRKKEADRKAEEDRIKAKLEAERAEEELKKEREKKQREKDEEEAIAKWKAKEAAEKEKARLEKEAADKAYAARFQEDLLRAGYSEKEIEAIMKKEKVKKDKKEREDREHEIATRPTYTRMSLRHLDIETLLFYKVDWEYDSEPGYILIKRWVPEWEQNMLWEHTTKIRIIEKKREEKVVLQIKDGRRHHHHDDEENFEWVRKKERSHSRRRSKSPGLLMYLAGGRPA